MAVLGLGKELIVMNVEKLAIGIGESYDPRILTLRRGEANMETARTTTTAIKTRQPAGGRRANPRPVAVEAGRP